MKCNQRSYHLGLGVKSIELLQETMSMTLEAEQRAGWLLVTVAWISVYAPLVQR